MIGKPNAELAYRVLDHIDAHPEQWDQETYVSLCGTAGCFAGWAAMLSGAEPIKYGNDEYDENTVRYDGANRYVAELAEELLGASRFLPFGTFAGPLGLVSSSMFHSGNTRKDLGVFVEAIFGPRPEQS